MCCRDGTEARVSSSRSHGGGRRRGRAPCPRHPPSARRSAPGRLRSRLTRRGRGRPLLGGLGLLLQGEVPRSCRPARRSAPACRPTRSPVRGAPAGSCLGPPPPPVPPVHVVQEPLLPAVEPSADATGLGLPAEGREADAPVPAQHAAEQAGGLAGAQVGV